MASPTQYAFSLKEMGEAIIEKQGITEGKWMVGVNFGIQVGNVSTSSSSQTKPSASVIIDSFNITRVPEDQPTPSELETLIVDAARLNKK